MVEMMGISALSSYFFYWLMYAAPVLANISDDQYYIHKNDQTVLYAEVNIKKLMDLESMMERLLADDPAGQQLLQQWVAALSSKLGLEQINLKVIEELGIDTDRSVQLVIPDFINLIASTSSLSRWDSVKYRSPKFPDVLVGIPISNKKTLPAKISTILTQVQADPQTISFQGNKLVQYVVQMPYQKHQEYAYPYYEDDKKPEKQPQPSITYKSVELISMVQMDGYLYLSNARTLKSAIAQYKKGNQLDIQEQFSPTMKIKDSSSLITCGLNMAAYYNQFGPDVPSRFDYQTLIQIDYTSKNLSVRTTTELPKVTRMWDSIVETTQPALAEDPYFDRLPEGVAGFFKIKFPIKPILNRLPLWEFWAPVATSFGVSMKEKSKLFVQMIRNLLINYKQYGLIAFYQPENGYNPLKSSDDIPMLGYMDVSYPSRVQDFINTLEDGMRIFDEKTIVDEFSLQNNYFYSFHVPPREMTFHIGYAHDCMIAGTDKDRLTEFVHQLDERKPSSSSIVPSVYKDAVRDASLAVYLPMALFEKDLQKAKAGEEAKAGEIEETEEAEETEKKKPYQNLTISLLQQIDDVIFYIVQQPRKTETTFQIRMK